MVRTTCGAAAGLVLMWAGPLACGQWQQQTIGSDADFRGLCAVSEKIAWVSGTKGTVGRTIDGGKTWTVVAVPGAEKLDFRDVEAFSDTTAYALSIGAGEDSRIFKTTDGGKSWTQQFKNPDREAFYDAIAFWDERHGLALADQVKGKNRIVVTDDGGATWKKLSASLMVEALEKEGAFAASGTCLITRGEKEAFFVTGGGAAARLFHSPDRGTNWKVRQTPVAGGAESAGAFSIAFRDEHHAIIVGGDYKKPKESGATAAASGDGGKTWTVIDKKLPFQSGVAWAKDRWITVGSGGSHESRDGGETWTVVDRENYNAVSFTKEGHGWAAGPKGRIARYDRK